MKLNVGSTDRMIRIAIAIVAAILAVVVGGTFGVVLWIVAAIMLVTGIVRVCPLYMPFKFSTNKGA
jgi:type IV secretory pathway TrbD component